MPRTLTTNTPDQVLSTFRDVVDLQHAAATAEQNRAQQRVANLHAVLLSLCLDKIGNVQAADALSLSKDGHLLPVKLYSRTQREFDRLAPNYLDKDKFIEQLNDELLQRNWHVKLGTCGTYFSGWKRVPRNSLIVERLTGFDREVILERHRRAAHPVYGSAARLNEEIGWSMEFIEPAGCDDLNRSFRSLGALSSIAVDDDAALRQWRARAQEIWTEFQRKGYSMDWG